MEEEIKKTEEIKEPETVNETTEKQPEKKLGGITGKGFMPGQSGNPDGRPKGSISVISKIKEILKEIVKTSDGKERERLETLARNIVHLAVNEQDKDMIKMIVNYLDGMPKQSLQLGIDETIGEVKIEIVKPKEEIKSEEKPENVKSGTPINGNIPEKLGAIPEEGKATNLEHRGNGIKQDDKSVSTDGDDNAEGKECADNDSEKDIPGA